jgi:hypothetical protein
LDCLAKATQIAHLANIVEYDCHTPPFRRKRRKKSPFRTGESITVGFPKGTIPFSPNENWDSPPLIHSPVLTFRKGENLANILFA